MSFCVFLFHLFQDTVIFLFNSGFVFFAVCSMLLGFSVISPMKSPMFISNTSTTISLLRSRFKKSVTISSNFYFCLWILLTRSTLHLIFDFWVNNCKTGTIPPPLTSKVRAPSGWSLGIVKGRCSDYFSPIEFNFTTISMVSPGFAVMF